MTQKYKNEGRKCPKEVGIMLKVAVCEDNSNDLAAIEKIMEGIVHTIKIDLDVFTSGEDLLKTIRLEGNYDIYLLDVHLPDKNGLEVAGMIRKKDKNSIIIFITAHPDYVFEAYKYLSFDYLLKPVSENVLKSTLLRAEEYLQKSYHVFQYSFNKVSYSIATENIFYFYKRGRKAYIYTNSAIKECNLRIKDILDKLNPNTFVQVNRSYIINLRYIEVVKKNYLYVGNWRISIGTTYLVDFTNKYHHYVHRTG